MTGCITASSAWWGSSRRPMRRSKMSRGTSADSWECSMTDVKTWAGKAAVISGAGSGIGEGLARHAALELGMVAVLTDVVADRVTEAVHKLRAEGATAHGLVLDVADAEAVAAAASTVVEQWGPPAFLGCNAGVEHTGSVWEMAPAQWARVQRINVDGAFNLANAFVPSMIDAGQPGHVLFTSS